MRNWHVWSGLLGCLLLAACGEKAPLSNPSATISGTSHPASRALTLDGTPIDPLDATNARAMLLLFVSTECPISNRYAPEIRRLHEQFAPRGVRFFLVYPNPDESVPEIQRHLNEFGFPGTAIRDLHHLWVEKTGATVTPEAALYDARQQLVYRGRIDNWYVDFGQARPQPTRRDLEQALKSVLSRQPIAQANTEPVGCYIPELP